MDDAKLFLERSNQPIHVAVKGIGENTARRICAKVGAPACVHAECGPWLMALAAMWCA